MKRTKVGIIGGGASGLMAAITAAREGAEVTILEHKDRVGKKILMTGNGKCNLTNLHITPEAYYSQEKTYAMSILQQVSPEQVIAIFEDLGLFTKEKRDGGIYPLAEQAAVVLDTLIQACTDAHIRIIPLVEIQKITPGDTSVTLTGQIAVEDTPGTNLHKSRPENPKKGKKEKTPVKTYHQDSFHIVFDQVILACGSKAAPVTGSDGSGYTFAKQLHLSMEPVVPALVQLRCQETFFKEIAGVRTEAEVSLFINQKFVASDSGELQITDYGISGIPVFQISRLASYGLMQGKLCEAEINFLPYPAFADADNNRKLLSQNRSALIWLEGFLNKKLALLVLKLNSIQPEQKLQDIDARQLQQLIYQLQHFRVTITKANPFENAQVCAGGISLTECNPDLSLKKYTNLYAVGELLDVDGKCGGYNLQWAWATGYLAGRSAARKGK